MKLFGEVEAAGRGRTGRGRRSPASGSGGGLHPADLAALVAREADLGCRAGPWGTIAPNRFVVRLNRRDLAALPETGALKRRLERATEAMSMEQGRRMRGPVRVRLEADPGLGPGEATVRSFERAGRRPAWAFLVGGGRTIEMTVNHCLVGRGGEADVSIDHESVSLRHALIWYEGEGTWIRDVGSTHGTFVDGRPARGESAVRPGGKISFGALDYRLRVR